MGQTQSVKNLLPPRVIHTVIYIEICVKLMYKGLSAHFPIPHRNVYAANDDSMTDTMNKMGILIPSVEVSIFIPVLYIFTNPIMQSPYNDPKLMYRSLRGR